MPLKATCHCGATELEADFAPESVTECTCTYCSKVGAKWAYYAPEQVRFLTPDKTRAVYLWNTQLIRHLFCPTCGSTIASHSPVWGDDKKPVEGKFRVGINARLFDAFDLAKVPVKTIDGKNLW